MIGKFKHIKNKDLIFAIIFLGGIAFHTLWEGKSQYVWQYIFCITPYIGYIYEQEYYKLEKKK